MNSNVKHIQHKYQIKMETLSDKANRQGIFAGEPNGFSKYNVPGFLSILANDTFTSIITGVRATYFLPETTEEEEIDNLDIASMLPQVAGMGIGIVFSSWAGYTWLMLDTDRYANLCLEHDRKPEEFRISP